MPANLVVRNSILALDNLPIVHPDASRALLDDANGTACCCGGLGCSQCCFDFNQNGPEDANGYCCYSLSNTALVTLADLYMRWYEYKQLPGALIETEYEVIPTNLPASMFRLADQSSCGFPLTWNWTYRTWRDQVLIVNESGSDTITRWHEAWLGGPFRFAGRFRWYASIPAVRRSYFVPTSMPGVPDPFPPDEVWQSLSRVNEQCDVVNQTWRHVITANEHYWDVTVRAAIDRQSAPCEPQNSGALQPCSACP